MLLRHLPHDSALVRALNDGRPGWSNTDHLIADLWILILKAHTNGKAKVADHPVRAAMQEKARTVAKMARLSELKSEYDRRKRQYSNRFRKEVQ